MEYELLQNIDKKFLKQFYNKDNNKIIIGGPCAIESYTQYLTIAKFLKSINVNIIRGGAYKPRTSPYSFQGLGKEGAEIIRSVKEEVGIKVITEAVDKESLEEVYEVADIIQIGSRNMQNFSLLKAVGSIDKPVLLKRGLSATMDEWMSAAEYVAVEGNKRIIMCERGIRSFNDYTRNTLDLSAIPIIKEKTDLPIIVDPSHGTGIRSLIKPMSMGAIAVGADGLMIEVHYNPNESVSDSEQTIDFDEFKNIIDNLLYFGKK
ncbi:MAG: 3-deoxy-7-phosphoheptulonate synthase [Filifactoraceae bacterium]